MGEGEQDQQQGRLPAMGVLAGCEHRPHHDHREDCVEQQHDEDRVRNMGRALGFSGDGQIQALIQGIHDPPGQQGGTVPSQGLPHGGPQLILQRLGLALCRAISGGLGPAKPRVHIASETSAHI